MSIYKLIADKEYSDGLDRETFERGVEHVITQRFWWPRSIADVLTHAYTDWRNVTEPIMNRINYVNVSYSASSVIFLYLRILPLNFILLKCDEKNTNF